MKVITPRRNPPIHQDQVNAKGASQVINGKLQVQESTSIYHPYYYKQVKTQRRKKHPNTPTTPNFNHFLSTTRHALLKSNLFSFHLLFKVVIYIFYIFPFTLSHFQMFPSTQSRMKVNLNSCTCNNPKRFQWIGGLIATRGFLTLIQGGFFASPFLLSSPVPCIPSQSNPHHTPYHTIIWLERPYHQTSLLQQILAKTIGDHRGASSQILV